MADTHSALIDWGDGSTQTINPAISPFSLQHTYALAGKYTATVTVTDDDGGRLNDCNGYGEIQHQRFPAALNADGTSVFKYKSTIPVKISFTDCNGSLPRTSRRRSS